MQKDVIFTEQGDGLVAKIGCDLDHHSAKAVRERIDARLLDLRPARLILDFSGVSFMDSSGLGLIMGRVERARVIGASVCLDGLSPTLLRLVRLSGILKIDNLSICSQALK